jgi:hypothetical protein
MRDAAQVEQEVMYKMGSVSEPGWSVVLGNAAMRLAASAPDVMMLTADREIASWIEKTGQKWRTLYSAGAIGLNAVLARPKLSLALLPVHYGDEGQ